MTNKDELACVYSALILKDDDVAITAEKISTILKAAKVEVEPYWPGLFANALEGVDVKSLVTSLSSGVGAAAAPGAAAPAAGAPAPAADKKEDKKKEEPKKEEEESDEDLGFGLFD